MESCMELETKTTEMKIRLEMLQLFPSPCIVADKRYNIVWYNDAFIKLHDELGLQFTPKMALHDLFNCYYKNQPNREASHCCKCPINLAYCNRHNTNNTLWRGRVLARYPWGRRELTMQAHANSVNWDGEEYCVLFIYNRQKADTQYDIGRNFYHDMLNICQRLRSSLNISHMVTMNEMEKGRDMPIQLMDEIKMANDSVELMIGQINIMRQLNNSQHETLLPYVEEFSVQTLLQEAIRLFNSRTLSEPRLCVLVPETEPVTCTSDKLLLALIVMSMIHLLAYSSATNSICELGYDSTPDSVIIWLRSRELKLQDTKIRQFQFSFTTKRQRDISSYTLELLHRHLHGTLEITSTELEGTRLNLTIPRVFPTEV